MKNKRKIKKLFEAYKGFALILLNTIILFTLINAVLAFGIFFFKDKFAIGPMTYGDELLVELYPHLSKEDRDILLKETYGRHVSIAKLENYEYEAFTQFKERSRKGKFVNINKNGFRVIENQCEYPISKENYNIFVFGGSTLFSTGVEDYKTIPSFMQKQLRAQSSRNDICVYNFGRSHYYSLQERALFENLILNGQIPNVAIFVDGLNEHYFEPANTEKLSQFVSGKKKFAFLFSDLPINRVIQFFLKNSIDIKTDDNLKMEEQNKILFQRYLVNKKMIDAIGNDYDIKTYFVVQPIPVYNYNLSYHTVYNNGFASSIIKGVMPRKQFYELLFEHYLEAKDKSNMMWLADMQSGRKENFYIDAVHYTAKFNEEIAKEIVHALK